MVDIPKEFEIMIDLGYGEFIRIGGAKLQKESACVFEGEPCQKYDFTLDTVNKEYIPHWNWFWGEMGW